MEEFLVDSLNLPTVDWKGAEVLLFFKSKKLFGAPPVRLKPPISRFSSYAPTAGIVYLDEFNPWSKVLPEVDEKKLLYFKFFTFRLFPFIFLCVYFFCTNDDAEYWPGPGIVLVEVLGPANFFSVVPNAPMFVLQFFYLSELKLDKASYY